MLVSTLTHVPGTRPLQLALRYTCRSGASAAAATTTSILASEVTGAASGHWTCGVPVPRSMQVASQQVIPCTSDPGPQVPS